MTDTTYTAFNQKGRALAEAKAIAELDNAMRAGGYRFYFIANDRNKVVMNELKGRPLPKRTSRGTVTDSLCVHGCGFLTSQCTCNDWRGVL
jgi:hypothetical protein